MRDTTTPKCTLLQRLVKLRAGFYLKVFLPSVSFGVTVWGSRVSKLFTELEKNNVRTAKTIHKLECMTPSEEVKWHTES